MADDSSPVTYHNQDDDGCPDEVIKKGEKLILKGVFFKTGSPPS